MGVFDRIFKPNIGKLKEAQDFKGLTKALSHKDWYVRKDAVDALGEIKTTKVLDSLIQALNNEDSYVRKSIVKILGKFKNSKVVQPLVEKLKDEDIAVQKEAAKSLIKIGEIERLIKSLKSKDKTVCETAVEALGETKDPRVIQPLIKTLAHRDDEIRAKAAESLKVFDTEDAKEAIKAFEIKELESRIKKLSYIVGAPLAKQGYYSNQIGRELVGYFDPLKVIFRLFNKKGQRLTRGGRKMYGFVWPPVWGSNDFEAEHMVEAFHSTGLSVGTLLKGSYPDYTVNLLLAVNLVKALEIPRTFPGFKGYPLGETKKIVSKLETVSRGEVGKFIYETTVLPFFQRYSTGKEVLIIEDLAEEISLNALFNFLCSEVIHLKIKYMNLNKLKGKANKRILQLRRKAECIQSDEEDFRQIVKKKLLDLQQ